MNAGDSVVILSATNGANVGDQGTITSVKSNGWLSVVLYNNRTISVRVGTNRVSLLASYQENAPEPAMSDQQVSLYDRWRNDGVGT